MNTPIERSVFYGRYSPKPVAKESTDSIDTQRAQCQEYAKAQGFSIDAEFLDESVSARKVPFLDRPGVKAMLEYCRRTGIKTILAQRLDRIARDVRDGLDAFDYLQGHKMSLVLCAAGGRTSLDLADPQTHLMVTIFLAFCQYEPKITGLRTSAALLRQQKDGRLVTAPGKIPYGFRLAGVDDLGRKRIEKNPDELRVVEYIIRLFHSGEVNHRASDMAVIVSAQGMYQTKRKPFRSRDIARIVNWWQKNRPDDCRAMLGGNGERITPSLASTGV